MKTQIFRKTPIAMALCLSLSVVSNAGAAEKPKEGTAGISEQRNYSVDDWRNLSNSSIAVRVQSNLAESSSLRGSNIEVSADGEGEVTLKGKVASERQQERAVRIAKRTAGVSEVNDDLTVDESIAENKYESIDDEKLAQRVAERIAAALGEGRVKESWFFGYEVVGNKDTDAEWTIEVDADNGQIELDGEVPRNQDVQKVLRAVREDTAVRSVENDIDVEEVRHLSYAPNPYRYGTYAPNVIPATLVSAKGMVQDQLICQPAGFASDMVKKTKAE